jgi:hypothetical protein
MKTILFIESRGTAMKNRTKKQLIVGGCLVICAAMAVLIWNQFAKEVIPDGPLPMTETATGSVTVDTGIGQDNAEAQNITAPVVKPDNSIPTGANSSNGAVFKGTNQTIQSDPIKVEYDEEAIKDPTKTPDGKPVNEPPKHEDHNSVTTPPPQNKPAGSGNSGSSGGLPGFDNVPNAGANKVIPVDGDGDINKQVGIME